MTALSLDLGTIARVKGTGSLGQKIVVAISAQALAEHRNNTEYFDGFYIDHNYRKMPHPRFRSPDSGLLHLPQNQIEFCNISIQNTSCDFLRCLISVGVAGKIAIAHHLK